MNSEHGRCGDAIEEWLKSHREFVAVLLIALTTLIYLPALTGQPVWDDDAHITRADLTGLRGLAALWIQPGVVRQYYPLTHTVFWFEHRFWGEIWFLYHLTNVWLHAFSVLLLWKILSRLRIPGAWLGAAFFAFHPIQVESVAWISELKNTLSGVFFFLSILTYLNFDESRRRRFYWVAFAFFVLGLLSKSVIAVMPAALVVVLWWERGALSWRRDLRPLIPFFAIGIVSGLFTAWVERHFIGAEGKWYDLPLVTRVLVAGRSFWFYPFKLVWPIKLTFIYPRWDVNALVWWQYLFPFAAALLVFVAWLARNRTRAPLAALLWFAIMLFPVLGFLDVYPFRFSFVANHFQYLAGVSIVVLFAAGIVVLLRRYRSRLVYPLVPLALVSVLLVLTWRQAGIYASPVRLYEATLRENREAWLAHNNLGIERLNNLLIPEAIVHFKRAIQFQPDNAEGHTNLANAFSMEGHFADAITEYEKAIDLAPNAIPPRNNLAWLLANCHDLELRDSARAVELAKKAVQLSGDKDPVTLRTLASAYATRQRFDLALDAAGKALQLAMAEGNQAWVEKLERDMAAYQEQRKPPDE